MLSASSYICKCKSSVLVQQRLVCIFDSPLCSHAGPCKHPGSCLQLAKQGALNLKTIRHFIIDECDKVLENIGEISHLLHTLYYLLTSCIPWLPAFACSCPTLTPCDIAHVGADMRADVQDIFKQTPHDKQVMMFSATLSQEIRPICKKFMTDVCPFSARACQPGAPSAWLPSLHPSCGLHKEAETGSLQFSSTAGIILRCSPPSSADLSSAVVAQLGLAVC